jgi:transcriptional regulator with XRE-family HTH domain
MTPQLTVTAVLGQGESSAHPKHSRDCDEKRYSLGMLSGRSLSGDEAERVRTALRRVVNDAGTQTAAAKSLEVTQQTVSDVLKGKAPGVALARRVADVLKVDLVDLLAGKTGVHTERPDRYPARTKGLNAARALELDPEAIAHVLSAHYDNAEGEDAGWWLEEVRRVIRKRRQAAIDPRGAAREAGRSRAEVDAMEEATRPKLPSPKKRP